MKNVIAVLLCSSVLLFSITLPAQTPPPVVSPLPSPSVVPGPAPLPGETTVIKSNRLVDGVDLSTFQLIQKLLVEEAASNSEVESIDLQMEQLRERRMELCFNAVQQAHPELKQVIQTMQNKQTERMQQDRATAREAKLATKKKS